MNTGVTFGHGGEYWPKRGKSLREVNHGDGLRKVGARWTLIAALIKNISDKMAKDVFLYKMARKNIVLGKIDLVIEASNDSAHCMCCHLLTSRG